MSAPEQTAVEPSLRGQLEAVLPSWTHWKGPLFLPGFTATWTTTAGTWSISAEGLTVWPKLIGPGGIWNFGRKDADHIIGVLRALDAIPETPGTGSADPLDVPCWICLGAPLFRKSEMAAHLRTHEGNGTGLR